MSARTRKLTIVECKPIHTGTGDKGEFTIYEITARNADGVLINEPLRSFTKLDEGEGEFTVEPYDHAKYGRSYTVKKPKGGAGSRLGPKVDELRDRLDRMEARLDKLAGDVAGLVEIAHQDGRSMPRPSQASRSTF